MVYIICKSKYAQTNINEEICIAKYNYCQILYLTCLNVPFIWNSQSIKSKNKGIVDRRISSSGIKVISKNGPTIPWVWVVEEKGKNI